MTATAVPSFLDALTTALTTRPGLAAVAVFGAPVAPEQLGKAAIELAASVEVQQEAAAMSSRDISETFTVKGSILAASPLAPGATMPATINAAAKSARDKALAIYAEIADCLADDQTVSGSVLGADVGGITLEQGFAPEGQLGRVCHIEFTIAAEAHTTP